MPSPLTIRVSRGAAEGRTRLSAFDAALRIAGVADFNLIRLSSVIPPASDVLEVTGPDQLRGAHGDALYCVYAAGYASTPHSEAWAGVAWSRRQDDSGAGLFVEHDGMSEADVRHELATSLEDLSMTRDLAFEPAGQMLTSIRCTEKPVCALVIATFAAHGWEPK
ncbi:MAG: pyruvoyl-dependent arginine decarboxylase [Propionibacteriaceae bacterium]